MTENLIPEAVASAAAAGGVAAPSAAKPHDRTRRVMVGDVPVGGGAPVAVQSMLNAPADDVAANLAQIEALAEAGCEIVRMAIPRRDCLDAFEAVCAASPLPVVADIHFDARIAIEAAARGAAKLRINPGNIGGLEATREVIAAASAAGIPIRIGVNAGSLDDALAARDDLTLPEKLAASATEYVRFFEDECDFHDLVVSAKAHDVQTTIDTYRLLAAELPEVPLHIGVTEAGTAFQGIIKSACGLGVLLEEGIGDTMRISLTDDPVVEVRACWTLLGALDLRRRTPELISCPTCGRCQVNLIGLAQEVEERHRQEGQGQDQQQEPAQDANCFSHKKSPCTIIRHFGREGNHKMRKALMDRYFAAPYASLSKNRLKF